MQPAQPGLQGAQSPAPREAFCQGLLTAPWPPIPEIRLKPRFVSGAPEFWPWYGERGGRNRSTCPVLISLLYLGPVDSRHRREQTIQSRLEIGATASKDHLRAAEQRNRFASLGVLNRGVPNLSRTA